MAAVTEWVKLGTSIIILPVTNGLYGAYRLDGGVAVIYGFHLTVIAALNALLDSRPDRLRAEVLGDAAQG